MKVIGKEKNENLRHIQEIWKFSENPENPCFLGCNPKNCGNAGSKINAYEVPGPLTSDMREADE
jgi:hypothetical protein